MNTKNLDEMIFIGRPFPDRMMDEHRTFTKANSQMEADRDFQDFLKENNLERKRSIMIVFGPENFMYWYGVLVKDDVDNIPKTMMKYKLPAAQVAELENSGSLNNFNLPLNFVVPDVFKKLADAGIEIYENPGDSNTPYLIQDVNLDSKSLKQIWYVEKI